MELVRVLYFIVSLLYIYTGMRVLVIDRNNKVNRIFLAMTVCLGVWSTSLWMVTFGTSELSNYYIKVLSAIASYLFYFYVLYLAIYLGGLGAKSRLFVLVFYGAILALIVYFHILGAPEIFSGLHFSAGEKWYLWLKIPVNIQLVIILYISLSLALAFVVFILQSMEYRRKSKWFLDWIASTGFLGTLLVGGYLGVRESYSGYYNMVEYSVLVYSIQVVIIYYLITKNEFFIKKGVAFSVIRALELMQEAFLITSEDYVINKANEEVERISGYNIHQLYGLNAKDLFDDINSSECKLLCADGSEREVTLSQTLIHDPKTNISFRIMCFRDIEELKKMETELLSMNTVLEERIERRRVVLYTIQKQMEKEIDEKKKLEEELSRLVYYDMLTDLFNRVMFREKIDKFIKYRRTDMAVVVLDIDNFKRINDTFGHNEGDRILIELADLIRQTLKVGEIAARMEGDEFLILYNKINDEEDVKKRIEELQEVVKNNFYIKNLKLYLTISIGVAIYQSDMTATEFIYNANVALYSAKLQGVAGYEIYTKDGRNYLREKVKIRKEIEQAIREDEFELYYQPQVLLDTEKVKGTEALIRWNHPELGLVTPGKFIPQIENENLIIKLGEWVIKQACRQIKEWEMQDRTDCLPVSINLSMRHFETEDIVTFLHQAIRRYKINPENIKIEITESFRSSEFKALQSILTKIREENISLSVDDFGTGYSSFHYLKHIKADILKIPREYITEIGKNKKTEYIVQSMIELAHDLGMTVVAEGVETFEEKEFLADRFCDYIQGYYYYKPMKKETLENII